MSIWNEDNYLEELVLLLGRRVAPEPCPESEAFRTVGEGAPREIPEGTTAAHVAGCSSCTDLQRRLQAFDDPMPIAQQGEWERTERRLDSWLERFFESSVAARQPSSLTRDSRSLGWWKRVAYQPLGWQVRWGLVSITAIALVIGAFVAGRLTAPRPEQLSSSAKSSAKPAPETIPAGTAPGTRISETRPDREHQLPHATPRSQSAVGGGTAIASSASGRTKSSPVPPAAPRENVGTVDTAGLSRSGPSTPDRGVAVPSSEPQRDTAGGSAATPSPSSPAAVESAAASSSPSSGAERPSAPSPTARIQSGARPVVVSRGGPIPSSARPEHSTATLTPQVIHLEAGTRVWITLRAVHPQADGVSEFRGAILLPVMEAGTVLLARDAEVSGTLTIRNGKKVVKILEFASAGSHYRLRSASGEADLRVLGSGEAVDFDAGRVLETWMLSGSTYERVSTGPSR